MKKPIINEDKPKKKKKRISETSKGDIPSSVKKKKKKKKKKVLPEPEIPNNSEPELPKETEAQKYQRQLREEESRKDREKRAYNALIHYRRRDLIRECVLRGCPFEKVVSFSTPQLAGWFTDYLDNGQDSKTLTLFDEWRKEQLVKSGVNADEIKNVFLHPSLKFGETGNPEDWDKESTKKSLQPKSMPEGVEVKDKKEKVEKPKREKDAGSNIYKGTKKFMTYELTKAGKSLDKIIKLVTKQFPEANENSIQIWHKRCLKEMKS